MFSSSLSVASPHLHSPLCEPQVTAVTRGLGSGALLAATGQVPQRRFFEKGFDELWLCCPPSGGSQGAWEMGTACFLTSHQSHRSHATELTVLTEIQLFSSNKTNTKLKHSLRTLLGVFGKFPEFEEGLFRPFSICDTFFKWKDEFQMPFHFPLFLVYLNFPS